MFWWEWLVLKVTSGVLYIPHGLVIETVSDVDDLLSDDVLLLDVASRVLSVCRVRVQGVENCVQLVDDVSDIGTFLQSWQYKLKNIWLEVDQDQC